MRGGGRGGGGGDRDWLRPAHTSKPNGAAREEEGEKGELQFSRPPPEGVGATSLIAPAVIRCPGGVCYKLWLYFHLRN